MNPKSVFYLIQLLEGLGTGSFFPIYTPWLELHGLNFFKMGLVNFFYHVISSVLDPFTGYIADRFGKRQSFIVGQILWTSTQYIYGASSQINGFLLAEGVAAIGNSLKSDALESWLQNKLGEKTSSDVMGKSRPLFTAGSLSTSILAGYVSAKYGMHVAWFISGTFFLAATIIGTYVLIKAGSDLNDKSAHMSTPDSGIFQIFRLAFANKTILSATFLVALYSFAAKPVFMYWPQTVHSLGMTEAQRGWTVSFILIPTMAGSLLAGRNKFITRDRSGLIKILLIIGVGLLISSCASNLIVFLIGLVVIELPYGGLRIVLYGHLYEEIHPNHRSTVNSMVSAVQTAGGAVSLLIMGRVADLYSPQIAMGLGGSIIIMVLTTILLIRLVRQ